MHPGSTYADHVLDGTELAPSRVAFDPSDYPTGTTTGRVRNHVAWLREWNPTYACRPPKNRDSQWYRSDPGAHLTWMENGTVVAVSGPYPLRTLRSFASQLRFL
ncbi:MAG: hypothetical protein ACRDJM_00555 [Actinomycetota bacterium]